MLHTVYPKDVSGLLGLGIHQGVNLAMPYSDFHNQGSRNFAWQTLSSIIREKNKNIQSILVTDGLQNSSLLTLENAHQSPTWEIKLLLIEAIHLDILAKLLSEAINISIRNNGRRILLRVGSQSRLAQKVTLHGFRSYSTENYYLSNNDQHRSKLSQNAESNHLSFRNKEQKDDYPLFTLYNKVMPYKMRLAEGLTFEHWIETINSQWTGAEFTKDIVFTKDNLIQGWVRFAKFSKDHSLTKLMLAMPEDINFDPFYIARLNLKLVPKATFISLPVDSNISHTQMGSWGYKYHGSYINLVREFGKTVPESIFAAASL
ncbi:MAG: hypothetical protein ACJ0OL_03480 [Dehalococcoidia bacterium]|mgnify:CR=1 FL=1